MYNNLHNNNSRSVALTSSGSWVIFDC